MNYFNYFTEIEDAFVRRRGKHLFLSPLDWALMETWKQQGIPLHIVLRGVERSFDSYEARPRKRSVKSLLYCQEEVEAQYAEWVEARVGASSSADVAETDSTPFSAAAIDEHLKHCRNALASYEHNPSGVRSTRRAVKDTCRFEQQGAGPCGFGRGATHRATQHNEERPATHGEVLNQWRMSADQSPRMAIRGLTHRIRAVKRALGFYGFTVLLRRVCPPPRGDLS